MRQSRAEVWDHRELYDGLKVATVGVNWPAYGPVSPPEARKIAHSLLRCADIVERRTKRLRKEGWKVRHEAV